VEPAGGDRADSARRPLLLVVGASEVRYRDLLARYHALCDMVGRLPRREVVNIDHGRQRFLLFAMPAKRARADARRRRWLDRYAAVGARVSRDFEVAGWAFKDGVGIARVEDHARRIARSASPITGRRIRASRRSGRVERSAASLRRVHRAGAARAPCAGMHWLGLRLVGRDGSVEEWPEQPLRIVD
jgi:hypothetical protein